MADYNPQVWRQRPHTGIEAGTHPRNLERLGGRGLLARIMLDEVDAKCDPLGAGNKLIFAPGLLVGHMLSSTDQNFHRRQIPADGWNQGSQRGRADRLAHGVHGNPALIIEDQPKEDGYWVLHLSLNGAKWEKADDLAGLGVYETAAKLIEKYGDKVAIALIGPGGEMRMKSAGIQNLDKDRIPSRIAARGGLGAVMGSKGLKAIVFDNAGGTETAHRRSRSVQNRAKGLYKIRHGTSAIHHVS